MNAAQEITRTLRRREQYQTVLLIAKQLFAVLQFLTVVTALYLFAVFCLAY